jgi:acyl carrier protein
LRAARVLDTISRLPMDPREASEEIDGLCHRRGIPPPSGLDVALGEIDIGSLDISELVIRIEARSGRELDLIGTGLRQLDSVRDLVDFLVAATADADASQRS